MCVRGYDIGDVFRRPIIVRFVESLIGVIPDLILHFPEAVLDLLISFVGMGDTSHGKTAIEAVNM
jgi:hypothetical protein